MIYWQKNIYLLVAGQFLERVSKSYITPFLPFIIMELGETDLSQVAIWAGLIGSVNFLTQTVSSPFWGALADRFGRKPMVIRALLASGVFTILMALSTNVYQLLIFRMLMGFASGYHASALTLISTHTPSNKLGYSLGLLQTGNTLGTLLGPAFGGVVFYLLGYQKALFVSGLILLVLIFPAIIMLYDQKPNIPDAKSFNIMHSLFIPLSNGFHTVIRIKSLFVILIVIIISGSAIKSIDPVLGIFVEKLYFGDYRDITLSLVYSSAAISSLIFAPILGRIGDHKGYLKILVFCLIGAAIFSYLHTYAFNIPLLIILRFILGGFSAGVLLLLKSLVGIKAPDENKGTIYGFLASTISLGHFFGIMGGGLFLGLWGFNILFLSTSLLFILSCLILNMSKSLERA